MASDDKQDGMAFRFPVLPELELYTQWHEAKQRAEQLEQQLTQARALLEYWFGYGDDDRNWAPTQKDHDEKIAQTRAFLAQHKEPTDGDV